MALSYTAVGTAMLKQLVKQCQTYQMLKANVLADLFGSIAGIFSGKVKMPWEHLKSLAAAAFR